MSTLNKFVIFQCDICNRLTELQIDGERIDPIRCIITNKCRGKLSRVGESSGKKFLFTPPVAGLQDYIQRGTVLSPAPVISIEPNISLNTGVGGMLSMAVLSRTPIIPNGTHTFSVNGIATNAGSFVIGQKYTILTLGSAPNFVSIGAVSNTVGETFTASDVGTGTGTASPQIPIDVNVSDSITLPTDVKILLNIFPISPNILQSTTFTYLESGEVHVISGPDSSPSANTLRFSASNYLKAYINGIELDPSHYIVSIPDQSVTFTPSIYESNNVVNIIVYNDLTSTVNTSSIISLSFSVLDPTINLPPPYTAALPFLNECAWGNYNAVNLPGIGERYIMHCTDLSSLLLDANYGVDSIQVVIGKEIPDGSFISGVKYTITTVGSTTTWHAYGVPITVTPTIGTVFTATSIGGSGDGAAIPNAPIDILTGAANLLLGKDPYNFPDKELNAYLSGSKLDSTFSFTFSQDQLTGIYNLTAPQSKFTQLLHPMIPTRPSLPALFSAQSSGKATTTTSNVKHKYIIGPT